MNLKKTENGYYFPVENAHYVSGFDRSFFLKITSLNIKRQFLFNPYFSGEEDYNKNLEFFFYGEAELQHDVETELEDDFGVTVIGSLEQKVINFRLNILDIDSQIEEDAFTSYFENKKSPRGRYTATMGFFKKENDQFNHDGWCIDLYITKELLSILMDSVISERFESLEIRTRFKNLYIYSYDQPKPPSWGITWFLLPSEKGDPRFPQVAKGFLESCTILEKSIKHNPINPSALTSQEHQKILQPIYNLISNIQKDLFQLLKQIKWLLILILIGIAILIK